MPDSAEVRVGSGVAVWRCVPVWVTLLESLAARVVLLRTVIEGEALCVLDPRPEPLPEPLTVRAAVLSAGLEPV